ncbi:MAG TPA: hypothetical protein PKU95_03175 [Candidatus Dojkabacteria bacterium]|jgi:hypothetical protein|nr:hypothetical protein [Candidatus Dojkabacteria bacterium]
MNDDYMYKSEDEEDMDISSDLASEDADDDTFYDPEDEGLSDFNFSDDELPVGESPEELDDAA